MNAQLGLPQQVALFILGPDFGSPDHVPARAPQSLGDRGEILLAAARAASEAWWEPSMPGGPVSAAELRLMRNREARRAAERIDEILHAEGATLPGSDRARLREAAHALSLGWEDVDAFLARRPKR